MEETAFITLHARVLDTQTAEPILDDPYATQVAYSVDYDFHRLKSNATLDLWERLNVAIRAVQFDEWILAFIAQNPDAVVLDLGCGLDSRPYRLGPPPGVDWFDVDFPAMIALRQSVYRAVSNIHPVATALEADGWLERLPAGRPVIAVADGVHPFMTRSTFTHLLRRLTTHFQIGELLLLGFSRLSGRKMALASRVTGGLPVVINEGFDDPHEVELWNPDLRLVERRRLIDAPEVEKTPQRFRWQCKVMRWIPPLSDMDKGMLRYRFGP
ncbi:class I SAM-dependent methyltransferase [Nocardia sp. SC052]|uniref:class I SAM-dependent methyltransferase n=1 Tax=Nocardia sichangensis TaxID=3385975 RepID=UPI0039A12047